MSTALLIICFHDEEKEKEINEYRADSFIDYVKMDTVLFVVFAIKVAKNFYREKFSLLKMYKSLLKANTSLSISQSNWGVFFGIVVNAVDCDIVASEFEYQSHLWKRYETHLSLSSGLNSTTIVLL